LDLGESVALQGTRGFFIDGDRVAEKNMTTPSILETLYHMREAVSRGVKYLLWRVRLPRYRPRIGGRGVSLLAL